MRTIRSLLFRCTSFLILLCFLPAAAFACLGSGEQNTVQRNANAAPFTYEFESGASWNLCWHIDDQAGLTLTNVHYKPPGEPSTQLLESASLAQILFKYDEDIQAEHLLSSNGLGNTNHRAPNNSNCPGGSQEQNDNEQGICTRIRDLNTMTTVRRTESLRRRELSLHAFSNIGAQTFEQVWRLSEDGEITPSVRMSGELDRFTLKQQYGSVVRADSPYASNANMLFTWRLNFSIGGTPNNDIVEQIDFIPTKTTVVRRSINTTVLDRESSHQVQRDQFRGWLVRDTDMSAAPNGTTRMGYYLDPQTAGFDYVSRENNWSSYDLSLTADKPCEQLASNNAQSNMGCENSLDDYLNNESLVNQSPVLWFSLARQFIPKTEDIPAITTRDVSFKIIPFDWSAATPFTPPTK